ncbi:T-cell-interacting, activating receptor on myeloid cells protein 1 [Orycteropus afer afer]|uniref:T-cell-interacting, activating receptor on myeloid cells protein 1 n=1 Tax=Orycteropus afer afer TaxID=1230840 RepID=UPI00045DF274|nr:T-cell-interacting, activating receptor on myeloid cells protein 1 [Orycteropus afer afer]
MLSKVDVRSLPKPILRAWPSSVVPPKSNVSLRCWALTRAADFAFRKGGYHLDPVQSPDPTESHADLLLTDVQHSDSGEYTCEYRDGHRTSLSSDVLLLLVTGTVPKPSLQVHPGRNMTAGQNLTLQCQKPDSVIGYDVALLKEGTSAPTQQQKPAGSVAEFFLQTVTVNDTGNYSCVYYQTKAPFWASRPSDSLEIWVTGTNGVIAVVTLSLLFVLLLSAVLVCRRTGPRSPRESEDVVTGK